MLEPKELIRTHRTRWRCSEDFSRGLLKCTPFEPRHNMHRVSRHRSPPHTSCEVLYRGTTITARPFYFLPSVQNSLRLYVVCVCVYIFYPKNLILNNVLFSMLALATRAAYYYCCCIVHSALYGFNRKTKQLKRRS